MSEDRTTPMRLPPQPRRDPNQDDQDTIFSDQDTPPTLPMGSRPAQGHVLDDRGTTPPLFSPAGGPFDPRRPVPAQDHTMLIHERAAPIFAWLVVVDGPDRESLGTVHTLQPGTTTIGRAASNHVILRDDAASAQHARIRIEEQADGAPAYLLYDMGSSNGTFVGPRQSYRAEENRTYRRLLEDGEYLLLGETTLAFKKL